MKNLVLDNELIIFLQGKKILLAFSHGSDSTALFYLLHEAKVKFECAFVNYKTRLSSDTEENATKELCKKFGINLYIKTAPLNLQNSSNFENTARKIRYDFFNELILNYNFDVLMTAHQLNDAFEWFLMQFSKGSGLVNLLGFNKISKYIAKFDDKKQEILICKPLINTTKNEILKYLQENKIKYFNDDSNNNLKFKRNFIRAKFSDEFISNFPVGVKKTMEFLQADKEIILGDFVHEDDEIFVINKDKSALNLIDKACKKLGVMISQKTRKECLDHDCVISHKIAVVSNEKYFFITPYIKTKMDKKFKEKCRILKIPPLIRGFLWLHEEKYFNCLCKFLS